MIRSNKGFHTPNGLQTRGQRDDMLGKLMLVVTEVAEAAEAVRANDFPNFKEEIADAIIRLLDIAGACAIDIDKAVIEKIEINAKRPMYHAKHTNL